MIISGNHRGPCGPWSGVWRECEGRERQPLRLMMIVIERKDQRADAARPNDLITCLMRDAIIGHQWQSANMLLGTYRRSVDFEHPCDEPRARQRGSPEQMRRFGVQSGT